MKPATNSEVAEARVAGRRPTVMELFRYFLRLGAAGFGGPIALVGYMEREFVERRRWVSREELNDGIAFSQLAPGPLAAQVAIYLGWLCAGARGATASGIAFVGPSFVMVVILAWSYQRFGGMSWLQGAFYGIGAAVIAIVARSAIKLTRTTLGRDRLLWVLFVISATITAWREAELVWLFLLCGVITLIMRGQFGRGGVVAPVFLLSYRLAAPTVLESAVSAATVGTVFVYFASAGLFVFGSGLAIVGLGTCGSCTSFAIADAVAIEQRNRPVVAVVTEEFATHGRNMATHLGHADLAVLVLPYPLEARAEDELRAIAAEYYPRALELLGVRP